MITDNEARDAMDIINMMLETGPNADIRTAYLTILTAISSTISPEDKEQRLAELQKIRTRQVERTKSVAERLIQSGADAEIVSSLIDESGNLGVVQSVITIFENELKPGEANSSSSR